MSFLVFTHHGETLQFDGCTVNLMFDMDKADRVSDVQFADEDYQQWADLAKPETVGELCTLLEILSETDTWTYHEREFKDAALFYLLDTQSLRYIDVSKIEDVCLYKGCLLDAATEFFDDCYGADVPDFLAGYIDYEAFARDCRLGGDMYEFEYGDETWTVTNANSV